MAALYAKDLLIHLRRLMLLQLVVTVSFAIAIGYLIGFTHGNRGVGQTNEHLNRATLELICTLPTFEHTVQCAQIGKLTR